MNNTHTPTILQNWPALVTSIASQLPHSKPTIAPQAAHHANPVMKALHGNFGNTSRQLDRCRRRGRQRLHCPHPGPASKQTGQKQLREKRIALCKRKRGLCDKCTSVGMFEPYTLMLVHWCGQYALGAVFMLESGKASANLSARTGKTLPRITCARKGHSWNIETKSNKRENRR